MMPPLELRFLKFGCGHHSPKHIGLLRALRVSPPVWPETNLRLRRLAHARVHSRWDRILGATSYARKMALFFTKCIQYGPRGWAIIEAVLATS